jgi:hypothetical protein
MAERMQERVELGEAKSVRVSMKLGSGQVTVKGGATALLEGVFEFSDSAWRPEVSYAVIDGMGSLEVQQPEHASFLHEGNPAYAWDLALSNQAPLELAARVGSGDLDLRLGDTRAFALEAAVGSGQVQADLAGATELRHVAMKVGSGRVGLMFEGQYAHLSKVDVNVASGVSDLVLGGDYPTLKELKINSASGHISLQLGGACPALKALVFNTASGSVDLGLSGSLPEDFEVGIHCVSGVATVRVPDGLGVAVRFSSVSGKVKAPGFHRERGYYVNDAYREGSGALRLKMSTVSGELIVQPTEA